MVLSNIRYFENNTVKKYIDFVKFRSDIKSFKGILTELTFLVRSFFFIMFGFYAKIEGLYDWHNILAGASITVGIFFLRILFFRLVINTKLIPLIFFAPRGLITILLFVSIPTESRIFLINEEVVTLVILFSIFIMMIGNMLSVKDKDTDGKKVVVS